MMLRVPPISSENNSKQHLGLYHHSSNIQKRMTTVRCVPSTSPTRPPKRPLDSHWIAGVTKGLFVTLSFCRGSQSLMETPPSRRGAQQQFVGFDLGTSGARISIIEPSSSVMEGPFREVFSQAVAWKDGGAYDDPDAWMSAIEGLLQGASENLQGGLSSVGSICVSGTSASCLMVDRKTLNVTRRARMYNYDVLSSASSEVYGQQAMDLLDKHCPARHTARARTGSLAKLLSWALEFPLQVSEVLVHQSDYVSLMLMRESDQGSSSVDVSSVHSDWHNCLKLGYDVRNDRWPDWMETCLKEAGINNPFESGGVIPVQVHSPGAPVGTVGKHMAERLGLPEDTLLVGGTTDSNAAFFAAAGVEPVAGTAVTSLGSTMAIKLLSAQYVEDADRGVYSHRFPRVGEQNGSKGDVGHSSEAWLVGGASNVGCAIFRALNFSDAELETLSNQLDPMADIPEANFYPLIKVGERFPTADANKVPVLEPVPASRKEYLHGLLQSISHIESDGFAALHELGAPLPKTVWTCGGGSTNAAWSQMRQRILRRSLHRGSNIIVQKAVNTEASFGAALLAACCSLSGCN